MQDKTEHTPRGLVIELSVKTEEALNLILSKLLDVKPDESRSFGCSSQALSFNAKANLLLDLNQLDKLQREKFQIFMEIRNKFAHINSVDTFEKCFALTGNYQRLKKIFGVDENGDSIEADMKLMFCILSIDITSIIKSIRENITKSMAVKYTQRNFFEAIKEYKEEYKAQNPLDKNAIDNFIKYIKNILTEEIDRKIRNNTPPHI